MTKKRSDPPQEAASQLDLIARTELVFSYSDDQVDSAVGRAFVANNHVEFHRPQVGPRPDTIFLSDHRRSITAQDIQRFSRLQIQGGEEEALQIARLIEPRLKRLAVVATGEDPMLWADIGLERMMPVALLGSGVARVLSLALTFPHAKGGLVLVDEIENGIHHRTLASLWSSIIRAAESHDAQFFATTHSREAISALIEASSTGSQTS